ncbi:MAG: type II toxin-antitoxin system YafQ family toxin [Paludibacteraceae bacterium]|nr:type II toxin-antitoxin system YafQ family toxin [Paludibacteraceae bacterium]
MKELFYTSQFKKDFKKLKNNPERAAKIVKVLEMLQNGETLGPELKAHELKGNYKNHMECHVLSVYQGYRE